MKIAIVYYSLEGNTKYVAEKISKLTGADTIEIKSEKNYPTEGGKKFLWGGKAVIFGEKPKLEPYKLDINQYDTILIGTPVWAGSFTPPMRTFLYENKSELCYKNLAFFACSSGGDAEKCFDKLKKYIDTEKVIATLSLVAPLSKKNETDEEKIKEFCQTIMK